MSNTHTDLARKFHELRQRKDAINDNLKTLQQELDRVETELVEDLQSAGLSRIDVSGIGSFSLATRKFYKVADRGALYNYLLEHDSTDLLTVNHQTLNAYVKEIKNREGEDYEVPGVEFTADTQIRMRKA